MLGDNSLIESKFFVELKWFNNLPQIDQIKHAQSVLVQLEFDNVKDNKFLTLKSGRSARLLRHT